MSDTALMARPARAATIDLAHSYMKQAVKALARMQGADPEGLHDTRVGLRRVDALLRRRADLLPHAAALRPDLRELARASNPARDLQVCLSWLNAQLPELAASERAAALDWQRRLQGRLAESLEAAEQVLTQRLPPLEVALNEALHRDAQAGDGEQIYGRLLAAELAHKADFDEDWHRRRIKIKRLRYLLTPWRARKGPLAELEAQLGRYQDLLGEWRDRLLIGNELESLGVQGLAARSAEQRRALERMINDEFGDEARARLQGLEHAARDELMKGSK